MSLRGDYNFVKNTMRHPCTNGSMQIVIETAYRAAVPAAFDLIGFGCREIMKHALGHGQVRDFGGGPRPNTFPKPHRGFKGKGLRGVVAGVSAGNFHALQLLNLADRLAWYWLIANVAKDFTINWTSLMYAENGCAGPGAGSGVIPIMPQTCGSPDGTALMLGAYTGPQGVLHGFRHFVILPGFSASVSFHCDWHPWPPFPDPGASVNCQLQRINDGKVYASSNWSNSGGTGNGTVGMAQDRLSGGLGVGEEYQIMAYGNGPISETNGGYINITLTGHEVPLLRLTNCFKGKK